MVSENYEMFIPMNLFELFDGKSYEEAVKNLKDFVDTANSQGAVLKVVKSELGLGVLMYLAVPETANSSSKELENRQRFFAEKSKKLIEDNRIEWETLRNQFSK